MKLSRKCRVVWRAEFICTGAYRAAASSRHARYGVVRPQTFELLKGAKTENLTQRLEMEA